MSKPDRIPRDQDNDYTREMASQRAAFVAEMTGAKLDTVSSYTIDPALTRGNIENFTGTIQVPLGIAGPLTMVGEHAKGDFYIPMATSEGTLLASYSRGMRVISECGGAKTTVVKHSMQRAPVFLFDDALEAREFGKWLNKNIDSIRGVVATSSQTAKLIEIEQYIVANMLYTRFCYTTGDAAGQNMTGKATLYACEWIRAKHPLKPRYLLSGNMDTDKKHSMMNMIQTRGSFFVSRPSGCIVFGKSRASVRCRLAPRTAAPIPRTGLRPCSSPPGRTSPTWPSPMPACSTENCSTTAISTGP
jgi:hydroxymethylglutaryl-CoA reductase (NADPH)